MLHRGTLTGASQQAEATIDWPQRFRQLAAQARDPRLKAFYEAGAPAGDRPVSDVPMLAIDIETTGLDPQIDEIVSVGLLPMTLTQIGASASQHWVVKPRCELSDKSVTLHGITHAQIASAPDFETLIQPLLDAMAGRVMVVHCAEIERGFLDAALRARIGEGLQFPVVDTMALEARQHRAPPAGLLARWFRGTSARPSIRLADSRSRYALPAYRPHHAPTDALASAELLLAQIAQRFAPETPLSELWR